MFGRLSKRWVISATFIWNLSSGMSPTAFTISFIWIQKTPPLIFRMRRSDAAFWFNNRLTSAKQKSLLYKSLADLVQSMMDTFVDPWLERITNRKSIFSMSKEDLETGTNELGQFFTIRTSNSSSVPMLLQQRLDEIHFKGTERPINQTIYREFNGISVLWDPIYAPVDLERHPYGTVLIPESTLETTGGTFGEMFLTSRG